MDKKEIQSKLNSLSKEDRILLLNCYGHSLTVIAREAYEFQGPGVVNPRLLRDTNEILHQVFNSLKELHNDSEKLFSFNGLGDTISAVERNSEIQRVSIQSYEMALDRASH